MLLLVSGVVRGGDPSRLQKYGVAGLENDQEVEQFFLAFKTAVARDDKRALAAMLASPIGVNVASGRRITIRTRAQFFQNYKAIFDASFKEFLQQTKVEDLWAKWQGVATPGGEVWIKGLGYDQRRPSAYTLKIVTINGVVYK